LGPEGEIKLDGAGEKDYNLMERRRGRISLEGKRAGSVVGGGGGRKVPCNIEEKSCTGGSQSYVRGKLDPIL